MNIAAATPAVPKCPEAALEGFARRGYHRLAPVDAEGAGRLHRAVRKVRRFDASLFLGEAEFDAAPVFKGVNPGPGRNLLERFADQLAFVEEDPQVVGFLEALLGRGYRLDNRKFVCGLPPAAIPDWLLRRIEGNPVNNLGPYVRPEYRDVTYFMGIDFHQDLIDFPGQPADIATLYVYLDRVGEADSPLFLLEGSHALGAAPFPHELTKIDETLWRYRAPGRDPQECPQVTLKGAAGSAAAWHGCTLHGTQPSRARRERISLRYIFRRALDAPDGAVGLDRINAALRGPSALEHTRYDLDAAGRAVIKANAVNGA